MDQYRKEQIIPRSILFHLGINKQGKGVQSEES